MTRQNRTILVLAPVLVLLPVACADEVHRVASDSGQMLMDAGSMLMDAGSTLIDAGDAAAPDASAQTGSGTGIDSKNGSRITVRRIAYAGADGSKYDSGDTELYDTQLMTTCGVGRASDGTWRCLPTSSAYVGSWYSDANCTVPVAYDTAACPATANRYAAKWTPACPAGNAMTVYTLGTEYTGTVYIGTGPGSCSASTAPASWKFFEATVLPPSSMVAMTQLP